MLINGCSASKPSVFPKNWNQAGTDASVYWRVQYRFHDPAFKKRWPKGRPCIIKGMNEFKTLTDKREATKIILATEIEALKSGWNPITSEYMLDNSVNYNALNPDLPFMDAFYLALKNIQCTDKHRYQIKLVLDRLKKSALDLGLQGTSISELKRKQLKQVLNHVGFTDKYFNHAKGYISSLFKELIEEECCETNLTRDIQKKKVTKEIREVMTPLELTNVMNYLKQKDYHFWRYAQIFMFSVSRSTELFRLKASDIDLENQEYTILLKKCRAYKKVQKVILLQVMDLWKEVVAECEAGDYLFSTGFIPGQKECNPRNINRTWRRLVKNARDILDQNGHPLKITADFYALKHAMMDSLDTETAQKMALHTNTHTTRIYQVNQEKRDREELKKLKVV